jgi:hypothetical protein
MNRMDSNQPAHIEDHDAERLCLEAAVEISRRNTAAGRAHSQVRLEMLKKIAELDDRVAALAAR